MADDKTQKQTSGYEKNVPERGSRLTQNSHDDYMQQFKAKSGGKTLNGNTRHDK